MRTRASSSSTCDTEVTRSGTAHPARLSVSSRIASASSMTADAECTLGAEEGTLSRVQLHCPLEVEPEVETRLGTAARLYSALYGADNDKNYRITLSNV